ncbi:DoxX family protein [Novipirellula maiorica]|nr:DoxX family protein [Rhodopirellula maiorica]
MIHPTLTHLGKHTSSYPMAQRIHLMQIAILSLLFVTAGVNHFVSPSVYLKIMPDYLPWPMALVYVSGFFEVLGGVGLAIPRLRRAAGWGLIALLVAVFPANVDMLINADEFPSIPYWTLVARLPLQGVLIAWVWWAAVKRPESKESQQKTSS